MFASPPASQAAILQLYMALRGNNNNGNEQNFQGVVIECLRIFFEK